MTASSDNFKNAVDMAREDDSAGQREWSKPSFSRIMTDSAGFGGDTNADGVSGLS